MSQFDKDDVEALGLLKLDVLGIRMQSAMAHAVAEISRVDGVEIDLDDEAQVPFDDDTTFTMISSARTLGVFQIESPGQRELVGKSGIDSFERHHHRHLALPAGTGQERHDHALPRGQAGLEDRPLHPRGPAPDPGADPGRGGLPRAGHRDHRPVRRGLLRRGRREAARARRRRGDGRDQGVVLPPRAGPRLRPPAGRADLEGARGVRVVRLLQGARRGLRAADLPVGVAQGPLAGALPGRGAHPRPGDVSQAADPRRRPPVRGRGARPRRQRLRAPPTSSSASGTDGYAIRLALAEVKGISERRGRPHRRRPRRHRRGLHDPLRLALRLLRTAPGSPGRCWSGWCWPGLRRHLPHRRRRADVRPRGRLTRRDLLLQVAELDLHARVLDRTSRGRGLARRGAVSHASGARRRRRPREDRRARQHRPRPPGRCGRRPRAAAQSRPRPRRARSSPCS